MTTTKVINNLKPLKKGLLFIILLACNMFVIAQNQVETGFEITNAKPPKNGGNTLYYRYFFPKKYEKLFFATSDTAYLVRTDKETGAKAKRIVLKSDMKGQHRSPLYGFLFEIGPLDNLKTMKAHSIELISADGQNSTTDKISEGDIKKLRKMYSATGPAKNSKEKLKNFKNSGNSQGELMGANQNIVIVKRKKCAVKKREIRKNGINGVKEMTTGF